MRCFTVGGGLGYVGAAPESAVKALIGNWPALSRKVAITTIKKYGMPDEAVDSRLIWGPRLHWSEIIVWRDGVPHNWPRPHKDIIEQAVNYRVPAERFDDLAKFDGSVFAERTKGRLAARCGHEETNFLALNLAHDIITQKRPWPEARKLYEEIMASAARGIRHAYMDRFVFSPPLGNQGDPDKPSLIY